MTENFDSPLKNLQEKNNLLNAANDDTELPKSALVREAYLLGGGIKDGFLDRMNQAKDNMGLTTFEFAGAATLGAGLTAMSLAKGRWETAANLATKGLTALALADGARRVIPSAYALSDTLVNPGHYKQNRAIIADNLGSACFDYPLMAAGGIVGSAATLKGSNLLEGIRVKEIQTNHPHPKTIDLMEPIVVQPRTAESAANWTRFEESLAKLKSHGHASQTADIWHDLRQLPPIYDSSVLAHEARGTHGSASAIGEYLRAVKADAPGLSTASSEQLVRLSLGKAGELRFPGYKTETTAPNFTPDSANTLRNLGHALRIQPNDFGPNFNLYYSIEKTVSLRPSMTTIMPLRLMSDLRDLSKK